MTKSVQITMPGSWRSGSTSMRPMLIAQARSEHLTVITVDRSFAGDEVDP